jgi:hypothetical protein
VGEATTAMVVDWFQSPAKNLLRLYELIVTPQKCLNRTIGGFPMHVASIREETGIAEPTIERWQISDVADDPTKSLRPGTVIAFYHGPQVRAIMLHPDDYARLHDTYSWQAMDILRHWDGMRRAVAGLKPGEAIRFEDSDGRVGILVHPAEYELLRASALLQYKAADYRRRLAENSDSEWGSLERFE